MKKVEKTSLELFMERERQKSDKKPESKEIESKTKVTINKKTKKQKSKKPSEKDDLTKDVDLVELDQVLGHMAKLFYSVTKGSVNNVRKRELKRHLLEGVKKW